MDKQNKYMVECTLAPISIEIQEQIPRQRIVIDRLFNQGVLLTYTQSADHTKLWLIIQANSESELLSYIESMPIIRYCDYDYTEIMFHDAHLLIPSISLN